MPKKFRGKKKRNKAGGQRSVMHNDPIGRLPIPRSILQVRVGVFSQTRCVAKRASV